MCNFLKSDRDISIRHFLKEDLEKFKNFTPYKDILLTDYNLCFLTKREIKNFEKMIKSKKNKFFSVFLKDTFIGYISVKRISLFNRSFELSISFDEKYSSKGYGSIALKLFLSYYFENIDKNFIYLNVNSFNKRAISLYKKLGFKIVSEAFLDFEVQGIKNLDIVKENIYDFLVKNDIVYSKIFTMELDRYTFFEKEKLTCK